MWLVEEPSPSRGNSCICAQLAGDKWKRRHQGGAHSEHCQRFMRLFLTIPVRERTAFLSRGPEAAVFQVGCRTSNSSPDKLSMTWLTWNIHQIHRRFLGVGGSVLEKPRLTAHANACSPPSFTLCCQSKGPGIYYSKHPCWVSSSKLKKHR